MSAIAVNRPLRCRADIVAQHRRRKVLARQRRIALTDDAASKRHHLLVVNTQLIEDRIMKNATRFGSLVLSLAGVAAVYAQAPAPAAPAPEKIAQAPVEFGAMDSNKDGRLSQTEAQSNNALQSTFTTLDADRDSYLTPAEFSKWSGAGKAGKAREGMSTPGTQSQPEKE
jgi:hypothetical protein